jgi:23S rRNA pseudouridine2605 synthase
MERLQKLLARAGFGGRRKCEQLIRDGRVSVDGETVAELGARADPARSDIRVDGRPISVPAGHVYVALNKPPGYVTTRRDPHGRPTVMDLVPPALRRRAYPVGRLDRDTTGLLLLTDDGELAQRLTHPRYHVPREYVADVEGTPGERELRKLRSGVDLGDGPTQPAEAMLLHSSRWESRLRIILHEGRNRQVRRMCKAIGHPVRRLRRVAIGPLRLGEMSLGEIRNLRPGEVMALRQAVELPVKEDDDAGR